MLIIFYLLLMLRIGRGTGGQIIESKTVHVGDNVTFTCVREGSGTLFWIRIVSGNVPKILARSHSLKDGDRITATERPGTFILHIEKAELSDTSVYYCVKIHQRDLTFLKGIDLKVQETKSDVTAAPTSRPVRPDDPPLCSNLSDPERKLCPEVKFVCCFRAESHLRFNGTKHVHEENPDGLSTKKCICSFLKNMTCFDGGISCAVTTREEISEDSTKPDTDENSICSCKDSTVLFLLCAALAISLVVIAFLIYSIKKLKKKSSYGAVALQMNATANANQSRETDEDSLIYTTATFTSRKASSSRAGTRDKKTSEEESIYTDVRTLRLDEKS